MLEIKVIRKCKKCGRNTVEGTVCYCNHVVKSSHLNK